MQPADKYRQKAAFTVTVKFARPEMKTKIHRFRWNFSSWARSQRPCVVAELAEGNTTSYHILFCFSPIKPSSYRHPNFTKAVASVRALADNSSVTLKEQWCGPSNYKRYWNAEVLPDLPLGSEFKEGGERRRWRKCHTGKCGVVVGVWLFFNC